MASIQKDIQVDVPVSVAYNQWTQFEEFPRFMEGVTAVQQLTETRLHWHANIGGKNLEWDAKITEQVPDQRISWKSVEGKENAGSVAFEAIDAGRTKVSLTMTYDPEGLIENVGDFVGVFSRRVSGDMERFKVFIEGRGAETGEWRGEVHEGTKEPPSYGAGPSDRS